MPNHLYWCAISLIPVALVALYYKRKSRRLNRFSAIGVAVSAGLWLYVSTIGMYSEGKTHAIGRHLKFISFVDDPVGFVVAYWFHILGGVAFIALGLCGAICEIRGVEVGFWKRRPKGKFNSSANPDAPDPARRLP